MHIALYSAFYQPETLSYVQETIQYLKKKKHQIAIAQRFEKHLDSALCSDCTFFDDLDSLSYKPDFLFSIGGDGTLLRSIPVIRDSEIPILGINTGRLGFLTTLRKEQLMQGLDQFFEGRYSLVKRSVLHVRTAQSVEALEDFGYALNEVTINRKNTTSMLSIETKLDGKEVNTYWADGLIVATPTGSTGYSLSSGGPILAPDTKGWVLNPIAPHNINIRPLIIPDTTPISIKVTGRGTHHLISLDSRVITLENGYDITIEKAAFFVYTVQLEADSFLKTLREKLLWGQDTRNTQ